MELLQMGDLGQEITWWDKSRINQSTGWWQEDPIKVCVNFIAATRLRTYWKSWLLSCLSFWPPLMPTFHRAEFKPQMSWINHVLYHVLVSPETHLASFSVCKLCGWLEKVTGNPHWLSPVTRILFWKLQFPWLKWVNFLPNRKKCVLFMPTD